MICIYQLNFSRGTYVGKTTNLKTRIARHLQMNSCGQKLKDAWKEQTYIGYVVLEECTSEELDSKEAYWISKLNPSLNSLPGGEGMSGLNSPRNKTSKEEIEEIVRMLELNFKYSVIAEQLDLPYTRVYDICTGHSHSWATAHLDLTKFKGNKDDLVIYDKDNTRHVIKYGTRSEFCTDNGYPQSALNKLTNSYSIHGLSLAPHKMYKVQTPEEIIDMTEFNLFYKLRGMPSPSYAIERVMKKRRDYKGWKILEEIPTKK